MRGRSRGRNFSKSHSLYIGEQIGIFSSARTHKQRKREGLEFFQVPKAIYRGKARSINEYHSLQPVHRGQGRNFSKFQSLYIEGELQILPSFTERKGRGGLVITDFQIGGKLGIFGVPYFPNMTSSKGKGNNKYFLSLFNEYYEHFSILNRNTTMILFS